MGHRVARVQTEIEKRKLQLVAIYQDWRKTGQPSPKMTVEGESELRMALRHVRTGRRCIVRQLNVVATLRSKGLRTSEAETVLHWLEEVQRGFEDHYEKILSAGLEQIELAERALVAAPESTPWWFKSVIDR